MSGLLHVHSAIRPGGGPAGYLHELREALGEAKRWSAELQIAVEERSFPDDDGRASRWIERIKQKIQRAQLLGLSRPMPEVVEAYATIVFNFRRARSWAAANVGPLRGRGKVVLHDPFLADALVRLDPDWAREHLCLMTHAPDFFIRQTVGDILEESDVLPGAERLVRHFVEWERRVLRAVRASIWPCAYSMEAHQSSGTSAPRGRSEFCATGVARPAIGRDVQDIRRSWGATPDQTVVLFLGRPHPHKGFHIFEQLAERARARGRADLVFLWGGPDRRRAGGQAVRHLGYVADNGAALLAADLNIVPNTATYMDLGVLQGLSLGAPLLLSRRGGNKELLAAVPGLPGFDPVADDAAEAAIDAAILAYRDPRLRDATISAWERCYSPAAFVENQYELAQRLAS